MRKYVEGYTDAWEQRKFKNTILIERGGSPRPIEEYITNSENGLNWIKIGDAPSMGKYITKTAEKIKPEGLSKTREVHPGDLILSNSMSFGRPYIMAINGCIHDGWLLLRNDKNLYNLQFLCHLLGSENMLQQYKSFAAGSTVNNLNKELVGSTTVSFPKKDEQGKLGAFFNSIDNLITLHQRKLDKLGNVKKALLEKMFPKNDSNVPEIRFKGYTDAWEQRKFDEVISRIATGLNPRDNFKLNSGGTNYYVTIKNFEHGHLHLDENCDKIDDTALKQIQERSDLQKDDILFSSIGRVGDCYLIESKPKNWNINESVFTLRPNKAAVNPLYMFHTIHADCVLSYILNNVTGSTFKSIKISDLKKAIIPLPNKEEQKKLGIFLSKLDNLITLHQRKQINFFKEKLKC